MSDSDGSPQRKDRLYCWSRSHNPVALGRAGKILAEQEERRLAEAAVPVQKPAGQPQAAPSGPDPPAPKPARPEEAAPATQAAAPAALLAGGAPDAPPDQPHGTTAAAQASQATGRPGRCRVRPALDGLKTLRQAGRKRLCGSRGEQRGHPVLLSHPAQAPFEPPQAVPAERVPGAQGRLPRREATACLRPCPQAHAGGYQAAAAATSCCSSRA